MIFVRHPERSSASKYRPEGVEMAMEFLTVYWRDMLRFFRFRALLISSLIQPALWLALYGGAMSSSFSRFDSTLNLSHAGVSISYLTFLGAGVIALTALFTSLFGGMFLIFDKEFGLLREVFASPMPRTHIIIGIGLSGITKSLLQVSVIIGFGLLIGVRFFSGRAPLQIILDILGIFAFVGVFSLGILFLSSAISLSMDNHEGLQGVITLLSMPIFFASNALYSIDVFPWPLKVASAINPLTHLINGVRYFAIGNDFYAMGYHYAYSTDDVVRSMLALTAFAGFMFLVARWALKRAVVV